MSETDCLVIKRDETSKTFSLDDLDETSEIDPLDAPNRSFASPQVAFSDHFSLEAPSDEVRFHSCAVRVYSSATTQFQIVEKTARAVDEEEDTQYKTNKPHLKTKITSDGSSSLTLLHACYALVAFLVMGFLLIFCIEVLFFLFVSLISQGGLTSNQYFRWDYLLGTIFSIPVFVHGLASALTMGTEFVVDSWKGHQFFRSVLRISAALIDWFYFWLFWGIPLCVMLGKMFISQDGHWWKSTALTWFVCVTIAFLTFCLVVFLFEVRAALKLLAYHPDYELLELNLNLKVSKMLAKRAILLRQHHAYSGIHQRTFFIQGTNYYPSANVSYAESKFANAEHMEETISSYSKLTQMLPDKLFLDYDTPKRQFNIEDVLDRITFVTDSSWNLEKLFCRRQQVRHVLVVNGPSRILPSQAVSSLLCAALGNLFMVSFFVAFLQWFRVPIIGILVLTALYVVARRSTYRRIYGIYDTYRDNSRRLQQRQGAGLLGSSGGGEAIYRVTETHRITKPTEKMCWILFGCEIIFLFLFPLGMLCDMGNRCIAILFATLGLFSSCRYYFNAAVVLGELGSLDLLDGDCIHKRRRGNKFFSFDEDQLFARHSIINSPIAEEKWRHKNRLSKIVGRISEGDRRDMWTRIMGLLAVMFLFLFLTAFAVGSNNGGAKDASNLLHDFEYVPKGDTLKYPTCDMTPEFEIPGTNSDVMADYAYMAGIAYTAPDSMPEMLDAWFGKGVAFDNTNLVEKFRKSEASESAVHYKLITFPDTNPDFAVVTIRGTNNGWDVISDAQLWSASYLAQIVRSFLPFGHIWDPILEKLVSLIAIMQSNSLREVAFYIHTTKFVNYLKSENLFSTIRLTGHSLGGGLAMITGAQSKTPAVGLSGPNTIITRNALEPPVSVENLNYYTFNIIPDRDPVPRIDDPARNTQPIACLAPANNFVDCHTSTRSLCEIQYTCGSGSRPTLCDCALKYGYPEPEPTGDRTFAEACRI